jgi:hypothetical protein
MQVEMDLCTIYYIEGKNCEADVPDRTLRIGSKVDRKIDGVAS